MSDKPEGRPEEVTSLNADDLDVTELEDNLLDHAAGGAEQQDESWCWDFSCGSNSSMS